MTFFPFSPYPEREKSPICWSDSLIILVVSTAKELPEKKPVSGLKMQTS